ncbi:unnamed protein product [Symbiodinium sp. KB8]|nr:unnamed protein product [Symbiodinium sp. KB8]
MAPVVDGSTSSNAKATTIAGASPVRVSHVPSFAWESRGVPLGPRWMGSLRTTKGTLVCPMPRSNNGRTRSDPAEDSHAGAPGNLPVNAGSLGDALPDSDNPAETPSPQDESLGQQTAPAGEQEHAMCSFLLLGQNYIAELVEVRLPVGLDVATAVARALLPELLKMLLDCHVYKLCIPNLLVRMLCVSPCLPGTALVLLLPLIREGSTAEYSLSISLARSIGLDGEVFTIFFRPFHISPDHFPPPPDHPDDDDDDEGSHDGGDDNEGIQQIIPGKGNLVCRLRQFPSSHNLSGSRFERCWNSESTTPFTPREKVNGEGMQSRDNCTPWHENDGIPCLYLMLARFIDRDRIVTEVNIYMAFVIKARKMKEMPSNIITLRLYKKIKIEQTLFGYNPIKITQEKPSIKKGNGTEQLKSSWRNADPVHSFCRYQHSFTALTKN